MASNRNSSSSSFYGNNANNARGSNNNPFKSNSQSTFDMFNINVQEAQKKVDQVFKFTENRMKNNEKKSMRSIDKLFDYFDKRSKKSINDFTANFLNAFNTISEEMDQTAGSFVSTFDNANQQIAKNTVDSHRDMYRRLNQQHKEYTRKVRDRNQEIIDEFEDGINGLPSFPFPNNSPVPNLNPFGGQNNRNSFSIPPIPFGQSQNNNRNNDNSSNPNDPRGSIRDLFNQNMQSMKTYALSIDGIADFLRDKAMNKFSITLDHLEDRILNQMARENLSPEEAQKLFNDEAMALYRNRVQNTQDSITMSQTIVKGIKDVINVFFGHWINGANRFYTQYEAQYNQMATAFNENRKGVYDLTKEVMMSIKDMNLDGIVNYVDDMLPAIEQASKAGLMGDNAIAKALADSVDKKIMPWLDTASEQWINMNTYLSRNQLETLKGQQLLMQSTQSGNRLLQTGVINSLTQDIEPLLRDVEFNTGAKTIEGYEKLTESLVNQGFSTREAYDYVKDLVSVQKDEFAAYQSGDASRIIAAQAFSRGEGIEGARKILSDTVGRMVESAENNIGVGAINANLGGLAMAGDTMTTDRADAFAEALRTNAEGSLSGKTLEDAQKAYTAGLDDLNQKVSITQEWLNKIENNGASMLGLFSTKIPMFWELTGPFANMLSNVFTGLFNNFLKSGGSGSGIGSAIGGGLGSGLRSAGRGIGKGLANAGKFIAGGAGKGAIAAGGSATLSAIALGIGGLLTGGIMMGKDAKAGANKSKEWMGSDSALARNASGIGGALGGTGPGIGQGSAGDVAKNIGKNTLKYGAIGAGIGSFIPVIGTAVGGAIGAGVGAITGAIGGERIAKATDKARTKLITAGLTIASKLHSGIDTLGKNILTKGLSASIKLKKNAESVGNFFKDSWSKITDIFKKDTKSAEADISDAVEDVQKDSKQKNIRGSHASGSDTIPYDGYVAKLHKGETVFNARATKVIKNLLGLDGKSVGESPLIRKLEMVQDRLSELDTLKKQFNEARKTKKEYKELFFKSLIDNKDNIIGSFASGTSNASSGNAILHKGEMIASKALATTVNKITGITGQGSSVLSGSLLDKLKAAADKFLDREEVEPFDDSRLVRTIEVATTKIVKAIVSDSEVSKNSINKLQNAIGKVKTPYDQSIINMEPAKEV